MIQMNATVEWTWRHGGQACGCGVGKERGTDGSGRLTTVHRVDGWWGFPV